MSVVSFVLSSRSSSSRYKINDRLASLMDSLFAIGAGLGLRFVVDSVTRHNFKLVGTLVGLWEGVILLHFLKKMPRSTDPFIAYGVRLFIDFLVTESLGRLVLVIIWTCLGMVLADVSPVLWNDTGLRRVWRSIRRDLYTLTRMIPTVVFSPPRRTVRFSQSRTSTMISDVASDADVLTEAPSMYTPSVATEALPPSSIIPPTTLPTTSATTITATATETTSRHRLPGYLSGMLTDTESMVSSILGHGRATTTSYDPSRTSRRLSVYPTRDYDSESSVVSTPASQNEEELEEDNDEYTTTPSSQSTEMQERSPRADFDMSHITEIPDDEELPPITSPPVQVQTANIVQVKEESTPTPRHPIPLPPTPSDSQVTRRRDLPREDGIVIPETIPQIPDEEAAWERAGTGRGPSPQEKGWPYSPTADNTPRHPVLPTPDQSMFVPQATSRARRDEKKRDMSPTSIHGTPNGNGRAPISRQSMPPPYPTWEHDQADSSNIDDIYGDVADEKSRLESPLQPDASQRDSFAAFAEQLERDEATKAQKQREDMERVRLQQEKEEEERRQTQEEERRRLEEERLREEAEVRRLREEEEERERRAAAFAAAEAESLRLARQEEERKRREAESELLRLKLQEEERLRKEAEAEVLRFRQEAEERRLRQEEEERLRQEAAEAERLRLKLEAEERRRREAEAEALRLQEEEEKRREAEAEALREEEERSRLEAEERVLRLQEEEDERLRLEDEAEALRIQQEEEEEKRHHEAEILRLHQEEEARLRQEAEDKAARKAERKAKRKAKEEREKKEAEDGIIRERKRQEEEQARLRDEEDRFLKQEEEIVAAQQEAERLKHVEEEKQKEEEILRFEEAERERQRVEEENKNLRLAQAEAELEKLRLEEEEEIKRREAIRIQAEEEDRLRLEMERKQQEDEDARRAEEARVQEANKKAEEEAETQRQQQLEEAKQRAEDEAAKQPTIEEPQTQDPEPIEPTSVELVGLAAQPSDSLEVTLNPQAEIEPQNIPIPFSPPETQPEVVGPVTPIQRSAELPVSERPPTPPPKDEDIYNLDHNIGAGDEEEEEANAHADDLEQQRMETETVITEATAIPDLLSERVQRVIQTKAQILEIQGRIEELRDSLAQADEGQRPALEATLESTEKVLRKYKRKEQRRWDTGVECDVAPAEFDKENYIVLEALPPGDAKKRILGKIEELLSPEATSLHITIQGKVGPSGKKQKRAVTETIDSLGLLDYYHEDAKNGRLIDISVPEDLFPTWLKAYRQSVTSS